MSPALSQSHQQQSCQSCSGPGCMKSGGLHYPPDKSLSSESSFMDLSKGIYFGHTRTDLTSFSHSPLSSMTAGSSCLDYERLVASSSWSTIMDKKTNFVASTGLSIMHSAFSYHWGQDCTLTQKITYLKYVIA